MKKTGFMYDQGLLLHDTGSDHPESPERLLAVYDGIRSANFFKLLIPVDAQRIDFKWLETVHNPDYIYYFEEICLSGRTYLDSQDNRMCPDTFDATLLASGGVVNACRMVMEGLIDNAFCAVRPPGHHAGQNFAMGFCFFNHVAIAARYLQKAWGIERVGIVDFDVHHGNGTQRIFEEDPTVFYYSIHQHPTFSFPGTGREFEKGTGAGLGFTLNSPVLPGQGDEAYRRHFEKDLCPAFDWFKPQVILVSCGFDAHEDDDMSDMKVTTDGFSWMIRRICELAQRHSSGRLISVLEGGYCIRRLPELARNHVEILIGC